MCNCRAPGLTYRPKLWQRHSVDQCEAPLGGLSSHQLSMRCGLRRCKWLQVGERSQKATVRLQASRAAVSVRVRDLGERSEVSRLQEVRSAMPGPHLALSRYASPHDAVLRLSCTSASATHHH